MTYVYKQKVVFINLSNTQDGHQVPSFYVDKRNLYGHTFSQEMLRKTVKLFWSILYYLCEKLRGR